MIGFIFKWLIFGWFYGFILLCQRMWGVNPKDAYTAGGCLPICMMGVSIAFWIGVLSVLGF